MNATTQDISGLVGEKEIKALPLNGRSYDLLLMLNPGIVNFTWEKTGGIGVSNSTTGNNFSVSGNRPQQNLFLLNGVEFTGAAENNMQPGGPSQNLMGVEAVREFNVLRDSYGAEYGKRPGAQVTIVTQSGTNQVHGSVYEYLRNNALDAPNYFDVGSAPPFQRNQFGGALGGPIQKNKTFLFGNFEAFIQNLHQTSVAFVPDLASRAAAVPSVKPLLNLWPTPSPTDPDFSGIAQVSSSPLQTIREYFGTARFDHNFSANDTFSAVYTIDDGNDFTPTYFNPYSTDILTLREQVLTLEETHVFSPTLLNTARFGFSRAGYFFTGEPTPGTPAASVPGFLVGHQVGAVVVGGSAASNPQAQIGLAGSNNGSNLTMARNLYTYEDRVSWTHGAHQFSFGAWFQQFQSNETIALSQYGQATFTSLATFLTGVTSTLSVRSRADGDELALAVWRALRAGHHPGESDVDADARLPRRVLDRMERGARSRRELHLHQRSDLQPATNRQQRLHDEQREVPAAAARRHRVEPPSWEDRDSRRLRHVQRAAGCAWLSHGPERAVQSDVQHCGTCPFRSLPINPAAPVPAEGIAGARWSAAGSEDADADFVLAGHRTSTHTEHDIDASLRGLARLPRDRRRRCQHADSDDLSGIAVPGDLSQQLSGRVGGHAGSGRLVLHSGRDAEGQSHDREHLDMVLLGRQPLQRAAGRCEPPLQQWPVASRRLHLVEGAGRWRLGERHHHRKRAGPGVESVRHSCRLGTSDLRRAKYRRDQRGVRLAVRPGQSLCE